MVKLLCCNQPNKSCLQINRIKYYYNIRKSEKNRGSFLFGRAVLILVWLKINVMERWLVVLINGF